MFAAPRYNGVPFRKSTRSAGNGACVEVATASDRIAVRDSKDPSGPVLEFSAGGWAGFLAFVKTDRAARRAE